MAEYIEREEYCEKHCRCSNEYCDKESCPIWKAPAADVAPVVHWILPDEKLPPNGQYVLCWYEYFRFGAYNRMYQTFGIGYQFNGSWGGEVAQGQKAKVLAWMPLPKPPKMEGGERKDGADNE